MPYISPSPGDVHVNRPLTNLLVGYMQDESGFVADSIFPNIPVSKQSDSYFEYDRGDWNRDDMKDRAPGAESAGAVYGLDTKTYYARVKAVHHNIPDQLLDNADNPLMLDRDATLFVARKALLNREVSWVARYFKTGLTPGQVWTFVADGVDSGATAAATFDPTSGANNKVLRWNDAASSPIEDIRKGMTYVQQRTGFRPNKLTIGRPVYDVLQDHPDVVARIDRGQTTGPAKANRDSIAALLELDAVLVMEAIYNTAKKSVSNAVSHDFIGGKNALLTYSPETAGVMLPSAGYTFSWTGRAGASTQGARIKRFRMEHLEVTRIEAQQAFDQKLIGGDLGYFFEGIIA